LKYSSSGDIHLQSSLETFTPRATQSGGDLRSVLKCNIKCIWFWFNCSTFIEIDFRLFYCNYVTYHHFWRATVPTLYLTIIPRAARWIWVGSNHLISISWNDMGSGDLALFDRSSECFSAKERDTTSAGIHGFFFNSCKTSRTSIKRKANQVNYDMPWYRSEFFCVWLHTSAGSVGSVIAHYFSWNSRMYIKEIMWVEFAVVLLVLAWLRRFFSGFSGFPLSTKTKLLQIAKIEDLHESDLRLMWLLL